MSRADAVRRALVVACAITTGALFIIGIVSVWDDSPRAAVETLAALLMLVLALRETTTHTDP